MNLRLKIARPSAPPIPALALEAKLLLPLITLSVRFFKVRHVQKALHYLQSLPSKGAPDTSTAAVVHWVDHLCKQCPLEVLCLENSLLLWHLLRRLNRPAELRLGVNLKAEKFSAHAWVESNGQLVHQQEYEPTSHYRPLPV